MKLFKNKKNKALVAAVTMSLVMGVCGSALAAKDYYGAPQGGWTTDRNQAESSGFNGVWTSDSGENHGEAASIIGGIGNDADRIKVTVQGGSVQNDVIGGCGDHFANNNTVTVEGGNVQNVIGGKTYSRTPTSNENTVNISNVTIKGNVFGGFAYETWLMIGDASWNTINLYGRNVIQGDVIGGAVYSNGYTRDNTVNVYGDGNKVYGTVYGYGKVYDWKGAPFNDGNSLNIHGNGSSFNGVANFQDVNIHGNGSSFNSATNLRNVNIYGNGTSFGSFSNLQDINIFVNPEQSYKDAKLTVNNAINFDQFRGINIIVDTLNPINPQNKIVLLESPNSDFTKANKEKLKIKYQDTSANDIEIDKKNMGAVKDIDAISAVIGFDISKTSINLSTYYKLKDNLKVDNNLVLDRRLELNNKTLNMQDSENTSVQNVKYSTLSAKKLTGTGFWNIDVDLQNNLNDKIKISDPYADNDATINLNSIIVRRDLPGVLTGNMEQTGKVSVIEGNLNGIRLNVDNDLIKTATSNYIYIFTPGDKTGMLNYTKSLPGTIVDFIRGNKEYNYINTFTLTTDVVAKEGLGTTQRTKDKVLTLLFNKDTSLSSSSLYGTGYDGVTVEEGYTLKLQGEGESAPGTIKEFRTAVTNKGILEVENMTFKDNLIKDIVNRNTGILKLSGVNTIHDITNAGIAELKGNNTINVISGQGSLNVNAGTTTVTDSFEQNKVTVASGSSLEVKGKNNGNNTTLNNDGIVNLSGISLNFGFASVVGKGTLNVADKALANVNGEFKQDKVNVEGGLLYLHGKAEIGSLTYDSKGITMYVKDALDVNDVTIKAGNIDLEGSEQKIVKALNNNGKVNFNGNSINTIGNVTGTGTITVKAGTTTVSGNFEQNALVNNGIINLKGNDNKISTVSGNGTFNVEQGETTVSGAFEQNTLVNNGIINLSGNDNKISTVSGAGRTNVYGTTTVSGNFQQNYVHVDKENSLTLNGEKNNINTLYSLRGYAYLTNADSINDIRTLKIDQGTVGLNGTNTIGSVDGLGPHLATIFIEGGETTVTGSFNSKALTVNAGKLTLKGNSYAGNLDIKSDGALEIENTLNLPSDMKNSGIVTMKSSEDNTFSSVTGTGTFNVEQGKTTVKDKLNQKVVNISGGELWSMKEAVISDTLKNDGTITMYGDNNIGTLNNNGKVDLYGAYTINTVEGNGKLLMTGVNTTVSGAFNQKTVYVNYGSTLKLTGGQDSFVEGEAQGHTVNVSHATIASYIYGGCSKGDASGNIVNITYNSTIKGQDDNIKGDVYGGCSGENAYENIVNIENSAVNGDVYGGLTFNNGTAYQNTVNIVNSTINGNVYGGINNQGDNNRHYENVVNLTGSTVGGNVYGASNLVEANNLLRINGSNSGTKAGNIAYFQKLEFNLPEGYNRNNALLTLNNGENTSLDLNGKHSIVVATSTNEKPLVTGDEVKLINKTDDQGSLEIKDSGNNIFNADGIMNTNGSNTAVYMRSGFYALHGELQLVDLEGDGVKNDLLFVAGKNFMDKSADEATPAPEDQPKMARLMAAPLSVEPETKPNLKPDLQPGDLGEPIRREDAPGPKNTAPLDIDRLRSELMDNVKTAMETRANAAALLNEGGDFLMKQGLSNAKIAAEQSKAEGNSSMAPFTALGGGKLRYETGSHIDSKSWHGAVGIAKEVKGLTFGVAVQQGKSKYDAYVNKAHSEGNSKSVGGALFAEKKTDKGLHFETALRAGRVKNDYSAHIAYTDYGEYDVNYKESSTFYGFTFGGGKEFTLRNKDKVDLYGRYSWTHTGSSDATTNWEDDLKFDGINSHRIMLGGRYTYAVNDKNELYAGLGWQYELGGKVKGSIYGYSTPEPGLKGSSGMLELGWKVAAEENFSIDLNVNGWTGKQRGVMGGVNMQWKF